MNEAIDITASQRKTVLSMLERHLPDVEVWVYGSRANWTAKPESDLDMVVFTSPEQSRQVFDLKEAFEESSLPFRVDLFVWDEIPESFKANIRKQHVVLQRAGDAPSLYCPQFPAEWDRHSLHDLADWINGLAFRNVHFSPTGKPVVKIAEIKNGLSGQTKYTEAEYDEKYRLIPGDMLFSWSGQPETSIDVSWWRGPEGWLNQHIFKVLPKDICDSTFFYYLLKHLKPHFIRIAHNKQTTGLGHVTKSDLQRMEVAIPKTKQEQKAIAHILGTLDDKIELNRRMNETLESIARAIFKSWFVDFEPVKAKVAGANSFPSMPQEVFDALPTRFLDSEIGPVPEGWEVKAVSSAFEVNPSRPLRRGQTAPYLDMKSMPTDGHAPTSWTCREVGSGMRFKNGDTLIARITPCLENGKTAFVDFLPEGQVAWGSTEYIVLRPKSPLPPIFAYCLARTSEFRDYAVQNMSGTSGRQRVAPTAMDHYRLAIPSDEAAIAFGDAVSAMFDCIRAGVDESRRLSAMRDYLLPRVLSGAVRAREVA